VWTRGRATVSDFLAEREGQKTQKQGGADLTDICKIRFLMAGTQRLVFALGRRLGAAAAPGRAPGAGGPPWPTAPPGPPRGEGENNGHEAWREAPPR